MALTGDGAQTMSLGRAIQSLNELSKSKQDPERRVKDCQGVILRYCMRLTEPQEPYEVQMLRETTKKDTKLMSWCQIPAGPVVAAERVIHESQGHWFDPGMLKCPWARQWILICFWCLSSVNVLWLLDEANLSQAFKSEQMSTCCFGNDRASASVFEQSRPPVV